MSQTNSQGGLLCVGLDIDSPASAYDNDAGLTTYATLTNAVGVGCFVQETLTLNQTAKAGDQIVLYLGTGNGLLDVGLLSNATIQAKLSGTNVGPSVALNSPLLNLSLLSGNSIAAVRFTVTADTNQIQVQVGGLLSLLVSLRIYDVRLDFAKPTVSGGLSQTICSGNFTTLTATPAAGTSLSWYSSATSTTPLITANTYQTPVLTTATTYYIGVTRAAGCEGSERVPVVVNVSNPVAPVISTVGTAICSTGATQQTTLSVINPIPGTTYNWYSVNSGGTILASGDTYAPTVPVGTTNFFVEAAIGSCVSPARTQVAVTSNPVPALPTVLTQSVTIQSGQNATLSAVASGAGVTLNWYDVATGGTALLTNSATFTTPILVATKTYYVESQSATGGCVSSSRVPVTVTVVNNPLGTCLEANSQQTNFNGLCLLCGSTNPNNSVDGNPATAARLTIPVGLINGYAQQTLQFNNPGRVGDIVDVELEVPGGILDLSVLNYISLATYNGATFNNDRVSINNIVDIVLLGGNRFRASIVAGAAFDRVEVRLGGLVSAVTSLDIYQAAYRYKAPVITGSTTICNGLTTTLTATLGAGETVEWYSAATGGVPLVNTASYTTPPLNADTTYYVAITRNGCLNSERNPVSIIVQSPISPTITAVPTTICSGQTADLSIQAPVPGTVYNWFDANIGGNLVFTGTSFTTPVLTADITYFVEASIGSCTADRSPFNLIVNPLPAVPVPLSSNVIIQSGQNVMLGISNPDPGISYVWYDVPTGGTALATNTSTYTPTPALTANKTFYVEATDITTGCVSSARAVINVVVINTVSNCLQANAQVTTLDPGLLCVGCGATNPGGSVDGNINTAATLTIPIGVLGSYIQQTLTFASAGQAGDIIDVELEVPGGLLDISALSYITLATYNGVTYNNDRVAINNNLLNVQLLSGNRFKASFTTAAVFDRVEVRLGGVATLLTSVNIYGASYRYPNAVIAGATTICAGDVALLTAASTGTETFTWYDSPTGGSVVAVNPTVVLNNTTTYYVEAARGACINSVRQPVTITVNPLATPADVILTSPLEASCSGAVVLAPTSALAGAQFRYYTSQGKDQEIITGSVVATQPGVTFVKDVTTGALTVSGLTALGAPYNYYVSVTNASTCENVINTLKQVNVTIPTVTPLAVTTPLPAGCGSVNLRDAIIGFDTTGNTTYTFYDASNNIITENAAGNITASGVYSIQAQGNGVTCPSVKLPVTVTVNPLPSLVVNPSVSVNAGSSVTLTATSNGTLTWFDPQGNTLTGPPYTTGVLNTPGVYTYTVVASNANCSVTGTVSVNVIDPGTCPLLAERVYATGQTQGSIVTGGVTNPTAAVDGNPQTFSTITTGVGLLGVGTTWQNLTWPANIVKGTPVTIKLGSEASVLAVGQDLSIIGTKSGVDIGTMQSISGSLVNLISGDNSFEYTFVPSNTSGPQDYDGIRIQSASLLSVAQNTKVFDAYYTRPVSTVTCTPGDIQDIYYGATDLGLPIGALTATVGVSDALNVADNDITTFATMYSGVGALAAADLTVAFKTPSIVSDTLRIVVSKPGVLLDVNLLTGFSIQRYLGNVAVGAPIQNTSTLLSVRLLPGNTMSMVLVSSQPEPYDRVRIRFGGVAGVLEFLRVHTVERVANTKVIGGDLNNKVIVCPGSPVTLQIPADACSTYTWYDSPVGGNVVANGITYTVPATLAAGIYKYYVQPVRYGCEALARGEVTVEVKASSPENALTNITLNGGTATSVCSPTGTITLATSLSGTPALTNPIYYWYSFDGTTSQLIPGETTSQLIVNGLTPGTYTYYVGVSSTEFCETAAADRKQITLTILPPSGTNDISVADIAVCHDVPGVLTPTASTLTNPVFTWYFDANKTQPITNGLVVSGLTYAISATGVLTVTGLTRAVSPITYFVAVASDATCENIAGTLQSATIIVNDPATPTTTDTTQDFCLVDAPTFASIQTNETNVVWYSIANGGTPIPATTALTSGTYYAALLDAATGCESSVRLLVTISVTDPATPTTIDTTQDFCLVNAPTFASIQTNQPNVVWYSAANGGAPIPATTALTSGTYYASLLDAATGCESSIRLAITISVTDPATPTTTDTTQDFCLVNAPTFASIQTNQPNVVWYSAANGGAPIPATTALTSGTYYAALLDAVTGCESSIRLAITISVNDPATPTTTDTTQDFCLVNAPTFASIQTNQPNVVWYSASNGGAPIPATTALTSGTYYAALLDAVTGCESSVRLAVTISVTDPATPTTTDTTQDFCLVNAPTFASIQTNQPNVVWYSASNGGAPIPATTALTNGTYYAALLDAATGCESSIRLAITISVIDPATPTTTDTTQDFCLVDAPTFASIQTNQPNVVWYSAANGGAPIPATTALTSGTYYAALLDAATGCESSIRLAVTISVTDPATPTTTDTTQDFCLVNAPTFASIQTNQPNVVWYSASNGGAPIPATTALTSGTYYASLLDAATGCESSIRLAITISVTDPATPTTTDTTQDFCLVNAPTFASIQTNQPNVVWYSAANGGAPIPATTALTSGTYYAALLDAVTGCESSIRLAVTISVTDPATPTTTDTTQDFCLIDAPTFASIQTNQPNVVWYSAANGGAPIPATTALTSGTYYAALLDAVTGCESSIRLAITISVTDPATPTTTDTTQDFCLVDAPTFASIQTNQPNVVWYSAANGGAPIPATTALTSGVYYAALLDAVTGCESSIRLAVTISVTDPATPTTTDTTQDFCLVNAPTFASIQTNQPNVVWYSASNGGAPIPATTALTSGTYYASLLDAATGCESSIRLAVTISVTDPATPTTTDTTQDFCLVDAPTFASIQTNQPNVVWYSAANGGAPIPATTALTSGTYYAALLDAVTGCESSVRLLVTISVTDPATPTTTDTTQDFCLIDAPTFASIQTNQPNVVWYSAANGGAPIPATTALTSGTYYAALLDAATGCESSIRLAVTISVTDPATPTTTDSTQDFCLVNAPTFASIQTNQPNVVWYSASNGGAPIPATTALTSGTYYAALSDAATGCESSARLLVTISVTDPATPTTTDTTQDFCSVNAPTFASIQTNQPNVVWYSTATGGTAIPATTALTSGVYYAALLDAATGCQSSVRLLVTISVNDPATPTTTDDTQSFCITAAPTVANIQVNEPNVVWYSTPTGGTVIASTTPLVNGTYYGAISNPTTGCESVTRLQVIITINNTTATPTTNSATQNFCSVNAPTVANIQVNEPNVVWYSTSTGGTAIPATTALVTGSYYGAIASNVGCENPVRLIVMVNVNTPGIVTTPRTTQIFCLSDTPTVEDIVVNEANVVYYSSATGGTPLAANTPLTAATYYAVALNNTTNGCVNTSRLGIKVEFANDALVQITTTDDTPCVFQGVTYSIANGKSNYVWSVSNGTILTGGGTADDSVTVSWSDIGSGTVSVTYVNTCDETTTKSLTVIVATCSDLTITNTVNNPTPNFGDEVVFTITVNNVGQGTIINTLVSELIPSGYSLVSFTTSAGVYDPATQVWTIPTLSGGESETLEVKLLVLPSGNYNNVATIEISTPLDVDPTNNSATAFVEPICLTVYNEFTPNNDGQNDLFRIDCIETHPNNELKVFNRYGALVYSKMKYENDWDGTANVSGVINRGDMLPTGTYFYVIDTGDGTVKKGWLSIMR
ncbi:MAG: gliding motility-associated C-terminal domain-containing protein [Flavobacterium circumlabens]|uniref:Ig-like domain-containing protein n=1 Tax=Flavobacterium circumlabens TaxID=2133765 RepID=UPI00326386D7